MRNLVVLVLFALVGLGSASDALALPRPGTQAPRARVQDTEGRVVRLDRLRGKPVLIVYESRESSEQNQALKDRLSRLARGDRYRGKVHLLPIASVESFDYFPIRGFVEDSIASESERIGATIYCDWDGSFRRALSLRPQLSSVVLVARDGRVVFAYEGALTRRAQDRLIELLARETEPAPAPPGQEALGQGGEPSGTRLVQEREAGAVPGPQSRLDRVELGLDRALLRGEPGRDVAQAGRRGADRDPQVGSLARAEIVAQRHRHGDGALGHAGDRGGARPEDQRALREGALLALREDPHHAPGRVEQPRRVANRARPVGAIVEVHPEGADVREEGQAAQVPGVHQGVGVHAQDARAQRDGDERIPPGRVVGDDQDGTGRRGRAQSLEAAHPHGPERASHARLGVAGEPAADEPALAGRDHGAAQPAVETAC